MVKKSGVVNNLLGVLRILMGWIFLWPFLDKLFGLGFSTASDKSWLMGTSPTTGFLQFAAKGPFAGLYHALVGNVIIDWLFMAGLLLIGLALILGIGVRIASYSGALLLLLMWTATLPPEHNPFLDEHIIYGLLLLSLANLKSGMYLGFGKQWNKLTKKNRWLE
ncbi:MAG: hypothetical protein Q8Q01_05565 [archaeon]|nr:hypothetical protein [archaeon]